MAREKWERRAYEKMALLKDVENATEVRTMSKDEEKKQMELFRKRLQEDSQKIRRKSYRKLAAAVAIMILLPSSVYAATHYENIKEMWLEKLTWGENKLELAKIHDKNWEKEKQNETVYEAFGVKLTIYSCFFDPGDSAFYVSYKIEDTSKSVRVLGGGFGDNSIAFAEKKEAVCVNVAGVDEKGEFGERTWGGTSWYNADTGITYKKMYLGLITEKKLTPKIEFTKRISDEWDDLEDWYIEKERYFDMPKMEKLETQTIQAKENKAVKIKISQQSLVLCADNMQISLEDFHKLEAKLYTKKGIISLDSSEASYNTHDGKIQNLEMTWHLAGVDLSLIEKIEIGEYTFKFPQS